LALGSEFLVEGRRRQVFLGNSVCLTAPRTSLMAETTGGPDQPSLDTQILHARAEPQAGRRAEPDGPTGLPQAGRHLLVRTIDLAGRAGILGVGGRKPEIAALRRYT
jgi:hypothetical protein